SLGNSCAIGIDRNRDAHDSRERLNDWQNSTQLLLFRNRLTSRPTGFAADVDNVCPLLFDFLTTCYCPLAIEIVTSVRKGIWRHIQNSHDRSTLAEMKRRPAESPCVWISHAKKKSLCDLCPGDSNTRARKHKGAKFEIPDSYAGDGFSCGEMLGAGRTTPFDGTGVPCFSFLGSTRGDRRSSNG